MSRIAALFLGLLLLSVPARAEAPGASMEADIAYAGDPADLVTTFSLVDQTDGSVVWSNRNVERTQSGGLVTVTAPLRDGAWTANRDVRWCLNLDARGATDTVQLKSVRQVTPSKTYAKDRGGKDLQGEVVRSCIRGASHDGY